MLDEKKINEEEEEIEEEEEKEEGSPEKKEEGAEELVEKEEEEEEEEEVEKEDENELRWKASQYDKLLPDYHKKSRENADLKRTIEDKVEDKKDKGEVIDADKIAKEIAEEEGWKENEVKSLTRTIEKIMQNSGYVKKEDVAGLTFKQVQDQQVASFIEKHPEFAKKNDLNDERWGALMQEFNLFKKPTDPIKIGALLEKAMGVFKKDDSEARTLAKIQKNKTATIGGAGGGKAKGNTPKARKFTNDQKDVFRNGGYSEEEIEDMEK